MFCGTRRALAGALLLAAMTLAACGSAPTAPSVSAGQSPIQVTASDRLGWNQAAASHADLDAYQFGAYVDGERKVLAAPACTSSQPGVYECTTPLPDMTSGQHTLELVAIARAGLFSMESARSAPLTIVLGSAIESGPDR